MVTDNINTCKDSKNNIYVLRDGGDGKRYYRQITNMFGFPITESELYEYYQAYSEKQNNLFKDVITNPKKIPKKDKLKKFKTEKKQKELVDMFKEQGMTLSQIAKKNGCEAATVRDALRSIIGEDEYRRIMQDRKTKKSENRKKDKVDKLKAIIAKKQAQLEALD